MNELNITYSKHLFDANTKGFPIDNASGNFGYDYAKKLESFLNSIESFYYSYREKAVVFLFLIFYIWPWILPQYAVEAAQAAILQTEPGDLPATQIREPDEIRWVTVTAYSSTPDQTDSTPFNTANGEHVYWGGVASNFMALNSRVQFIDYHEDKLFRVNDRMHRRFSDRIDIWFPTREEATNWGKRNVRVAIWHY